MRPEERSSQPVGKPDMAWAEDNLKGVRDLRQIFDRVRSEAEASRKAHPVTSTESNQASN